MMRKIFLFIVFFSYWALQAQISVFELKADTQALYVGEPLQFKITLSSNLNKNELPSLNLENLKPFEQVGVIDSTWTPIEGGHELQLKINTTCFDTGFHVIKPLQIIINSDTFVSNPLLIKVDLMPLADELELYDIKDNLFIARPWTDYLILIGIIIVVGLLIYFIIKQINKKPDYSKLLETQVTKHPWDEAWERLLYIENQTPWLKGDVKEYYMILLNVLRAYLERAKNLPALESTYSEMETIVMSLHLPKELERDTLSLLMEAELVKFAKSNPSSALCRAHLEHVKSFLLHYKPEENKAEKP